MGDLMHDVVERELLKWAVQRQITCPRTGQILDVRRAVLVTIEDDGHHLAAEVMDGSAWDQIAAKLLEVCAVRGLTAEVIDGRKVNA